MGESKLRRPTRCSKLPVTQTTKVRLVHTFFAIHSSHCNTEYLIVLLKVIRAKIASVIPLEDELKWNVTSTANPDDQLRRSEVQTVEYINISTIRSHEASNLIKRVKSKETKTKLAERFAADLNRSHSEDEEHRWPSPIRR